jgi:PHD/YefM family antitoxin component YafN of YafNO toxin-antitoxin module
MVREVVNSREARKNWREVLDGVASRSADIAIQRYGKDVAVMIPPEDYEEVKGKLMEVRAARRAYAAYDALLQNPSLALDFDIAEEALDLG